VKRLTLTAEIDEMSFALNGKITCTVKIRYNSAVGGKKDAWYVLNISDLIKEWGK